MRRSRNQTELPMEREVGKALDDEAIAERSRKLCGVLSAVDGLKTEIRDLTKDRKERIKTLEAEARGLRNQIQDGLEMRKQGDLFVGEAQKALAGVAAAAGEKKPSEPHKFEGVKGKPFECSICGSGPLDTIHDAADAEVVKGLAEVPPGNGGGTKARAVKRGKGPLARAAKRKEARA